MTKEEILDNSASLYSCRHIGRYKESALTAMDEYAKQEAIEFEDWKRRNFIEWYGVHNKQCYRKVAGAPLDKNPTTSEELYSLYLQSKQQP